MTFYISSCNVVGGYVYFESTNKSNKNILKINELSWESLQSDLLKYPSNFFHDTKACINSLSLIQPRLLNALNHLNNQKFGLPLLLICSQENNDYLYQISQIFKKISDSSNEEILYGGEYFINKNSIILQPPSNVDSAFTSKGKIYYIEWIELEQLFGYATKERSQIKLQAGLLHKINGGVLIISASTLLEQPIIWKRLKQFMIQGSYEWLPLPHKTHYMLQNLKIPPLPFKLKLVICGNRESLLSFQSLDPEVYNTALYTEFEEQIYISNDNDMLNWCNWIHTLAKQAGLQKLDHSVWNELIKESIRYTGDHKILPLCPKWLLYKLNDAALYDNGKINAKSFEISIQNKFLRESYVNECMNNEILFKQIMIDTKGIVVGQINGLSLIEINSHPMIWGEPSRITCVVNIGNGEFIDVERQSDLSGKIHTKGVMILQSYLIAELNLEHQLPFSASIVFEQSYSEIDGDSASLAVLCALISALANYPLNQQIAVTGSIDQFGNVQPVGGLNEKIEGFFNLCNQRVLTGKQGVIVPYCNVRNLGLHKSIIESVKQETFHIWAVKHVEEAVKILTGIAWKDNTDHCLLKIIKLRIIALNKKEGNYSLFHWLKQLINTH